MKAVVYNAYGLPEVLRVEEVEKTVPAEHEVLLKIHASSINSWDWDLLRGKPYLYRLMFGLLKPKSQYRILGADVSGIVEAVGKDVIRFKPGDAVFGDISEHWGGFAEYVCVNEKTLTHKPENLSHEEAASIPQAAVLAYQSLFEHRMVNPGDAILIIGAGGGVGTFAVQMAKAYGAEVTCVDRNEKLDMLRSLGADEVIDYRQEDFSKRNKRYDVIIDVVANHSIFTYNRSLNPNSHFVMVGGTISFLLQAALIGPLFSKKGGKKLGILIHEANKNINQILEFYQEGKLKPIIDKTYSLEEVPEAMQYFGSGLVKGKVVISIF
jgi:NADPH:quinone reductase-like Zn-dependent oxidoreductase